MTRENLRVPSASKSTNSENPLLFDKHRSRTMAEAFDTLELVAALDDDAPFINDLPKELLVSIFIAVRGRVWVRHTIPCVCKAWAELCRSQDASPVHETLVVDFKKEVESVAARKEEGPRRGIGPVARGKMAQ